VSDRKLVRDGVVISMDPAIGDLDRADVLIDGPRIERVARAIEVGPDVEVIDAEGCVVLPGFVDSHRHTWQSIVRQVGSDWSLAEYFRAIRGTIGGHYRAEDLYAANLLGRVEALDAGITTMLDWSHLINSPEHADAAVSALFDAGGRSVFAHGDGNQAWQPVPNPPPQSADTRRVRERWFSSDDQLVTMMTAIRGPMFTPLEVVGQDLAMARDLDLRVTMHVGDGVRGRRRPAVELLDSRGWLGPDLTFVHCNTNTDQAMRLMSDTGATASISPLIEMSMGHGMPATGRLLRAGVRPSLSVDVTSVSGGDLFGVMRATLACERALDNDRRLRSGEEAGELAISTRDVLEFATMDGARTCGLDGRVGSLTPGKDADLIVVHPSGPHLWPLSNPVAAVVMAAQVHDVRTVLVAGEVLKRDGRVVCVDLDALRARAQRSADHVLAMAGLDHRRFDWRVDQP